MMQAVKLCISESQGLDFADAIDGIIADTLASAHVRLRPEAVALTLTGEPFFPSTFDCCTQSINRV